jgi:hypothetical protein
MAGIDKTYLNLRDYKILKDWCATHKFEVLGKTIYPGDFLFQYSTDNITDPEATFPVWNTPEWFDCLLAKHCDLPFIIKRLHEQYGDDGFKELVEMDESRFRKRDPGKNYRLVDSRRHCEPRNNKHFRSAKVMVFSINDITLGYSEDFDYFDYMENNGTIVPCYESGAFFKCITLKALLRKVKKWRLKNNDLVVILYNRNYSKRQYESMREFTVKCS